jgi:hypothetical protein
MSSQYSSSLASLRKEIIERDEEVSPFYSKCHVCRVSFIIKNNNKRVSWIVQIMNQGFL